MIRRLMVNDDGKWDYLPRGATLQIRDLGVYAVYGHEDKGRVEWKFEYLVQPRISPTTGDAVANEKVSLTCSMPYRITNTYDSSSSRSASTARLPSSTPIAHSK
jgi:hypothetical protein